MDEEARSLPVEDVGKHIPRSEPRHATGEIGLAREPLEHRHVWIQSKAVASNARVGPTREHFVIAWVGEFEAIRHLRDAAAHLVAEDLSRARDLTPEKRHHQAASLGRISAPKLAPDR